MTTGRLPASSLSPGCNFCGNELERLIAETNGFRIVSCNCCGLVSVNPQPPADALSSLYSDYHVREGNDAAKWFRLMRSIFDESAEKLDATRNGSASRRMLDVGCGYGYFIDAMLSRGWEAEGIDPSPAAVAVAFERKIPVRLGTLEDLESPKEHYAAITMFYVLEHLPDPMGALRKAFDLLAPGGRLLVRVPHTTPIVRMLSPFGLGASLYDAPFHLYDFSPSVLQDMLRKAGFTDTCTYPGRSTRPSRLGPFAASFLFGALARGLYSFSGGRFLLPGVSKTTIARKPL